MPSTRFPDGRVPVVLSAHAEELVNTDAAGILRYLDRGPSVAAVAAALLRTRRLRRHRAVVRAADPTELADALRAVSTGADHPLVARSSETASARTAFVFPGQGNQWPSMGVQAYRCSPVYRATVDRCAEAFTAAGAPSPLPYLTAESDGGQWSQTEIQGAQFAHAVGLTQIWRSCAITPDVVVGHSLGEVAAAHVAGSIGLADAAAVVIARATAVDCLSGDYGMAVLGVAPADAEALMSGVAGWLEVSAVNAAASVVVSGERTAVDALVAVAAERNVFARRLDVDYPGHTSALERLRTDLAALLPGGEFVDAPVEFIGSTTAEPVPAGTDFGDYWYHNLRNTVRFDRAVAAARARGVGKFVEISAHPALLFALGDLAGDGEPLAVGSGHRDVPFVDAVSANIAAAAVADPGYRWTDHVDVAGQPHLPGFPNAPMRTIRLWAEPRPLPPVYGLTVAREAWEPWTGPAAATAGRVAVVDLTGPGGPLGERLKAALGGRADIVEPGGAELLVAVAPVLDHPDAEQAARELAGLLDAGLLGYLDVAGSTCRAICLVTVGGEHVRSGEPVALPAQAALAAMHRSVAFERPDLTFRHLDLPTWEPDDAVTAAAVDVLLAEVGAAAVRDGGSGPTTFVRSVTDAREPAPAWPLDNGLLDDVVITGGSGVVGLHFARYLAGRGARRIVLLSRGGVDAATQAQLAELMPGGEVVAPQCDITSAAEVTAAAREYGGAGASLVVHAAGAAVFADHDATTAASFHETTAAKLTGFARMLELWPVRADTRILVCSSISGVLGGRGHAAYSAVNRMLDVMAGQLRAKGQHCVAARYGLWRGNGIAGAAEVSRIERSGLLPMAPDDAVAASLRDHAEDPLLLTADRDRLKIFLGDQAAEPETGSPARQPAADTVGRVRAELAAVLNLDAAAIDLETSLLDLGVDSLLALDLRKRLLRATGHKVPLATLLGGITGAELVADLDSTERSEKVDTRD